MLHDTKYIVVQCISEKEQPEEMIVFGKYFSHYDVWSSLRDNPCVKNGAEWKLVSAGYISVSIYGVVCHGGHTDLAVTHRNEDTKIAMQLFDFDKGKIKLTPETNRDVKHAARTLNSSHKR